MTQKPLIPTQFFPGQAGRAGAARGCPGEGRSPSRRPPRIPHTPRAPLVPSAPPGPCLPPAPPLLTREAAPFAVSPPALEQEEGVGSLRHPQRAGQQHLLGPQPHGGGSARPGSARLGPARPGRSAEGVGAGGAAGPLRAARSRGRARRHGAPWRPGPLTAAGRCRAAAVAPRLAPQAPQRGGRGFESRSRVLRGGVWLLDLQMFWSPFLALQRVQGAGCCTKHGTHRRAVGNWGDLCQVGCNLPC